MYCNHLLRLVLPVSITAPPTTTRRSTIAATFHHVYSDSFYSGLLHHSHDLLELQLFPILVYQLALLLYETVPQDELSRTKNRIKNIHARALESGIAAAPLPSGNLREIG